jgi:DNA-binding LacI/PurR family transcriptional regulator/GAF domain-containing protein
MADKPMKERSKTARHAGPQRARLTIGYTTPDLSKFQAAMWAGACDVAQERDANLICFVCGVLRDTVDFKYRANVLLDLVGPENVDGLIFNAANLGWYIGAEGAKNFVERFRPLPITSIGSLEGIPSTVVESEPGMRELVTHLIEAHSYRRIAIIRGPEGQPGDEARYSAYVKTLAEHNIPLDPNLVTPHYMWSDDWKTSSVEAIRCLLDERKLQPKVDLDAIIGNNDASAISAMEILQERGIRVPLDVAVVGFDDHEVSRFVTPALSTVSQPTAEQARWAAETLLAQLEGKPVPEQVVMSTKMVIRQSCGCLGQAVAQAAVEQPAAPGDGPAGTLAARRKDILSDIVSAVEPAAGPSLERIEQLLDAFTAEVKGEAPGAFLPVLDEVLRQAAATGGDVAVWQEAISTLRRHALPYLVDDDDALLCAEILWQQARLAIGETASRTQAYRRLQTEQQTQIFHGLGQALIAASDAARLMDVLAGALPRLGIPACYVSVYEDPNSPAGWSRLMLAYDERGRVELETGGRRFPSCQLVPDGTLREDKRYTLVAEPLYFQETQLGFVLFEADPRENVIYDALRAQISSALKNILLAQQTQRRALQLQTAAEVSRAASSILAPDELMPRAVDLIRERFSLYYAGLFLVDEAGEWTDEPGKWAVLRAGTGEAGRRQLENKHKLEIGGTSMIGRCVANKQARIALDVGKEAVRFDNPHLPETRSELALPLISRDRVIGALTIQSTRQAAFSDEDIVVFQTMADQLANAVQNARLLERTQAALAEVEATQRRYLEQAWTAYVQAAKSTSYETVRPGAAPLGDVVLPEIQQAIEQRHAMTLAEGGDGEQRRSALVAPIALRGEVIGVLGVHDDGARQWTDGEVALIEAVAERMAQTAENLRLLDETQRRAQREQTLREITARVRGATDPDTIVRTALRELGTTLGRPAFVRLGNAEQLSSPPAVTGHGPAAVTGQDSAPVAEQGLKPVEEPQPPSPPDKRRRRGKRKDK